MEAADCSKTLVPIYQYSVDTILMHLTHSTSHNTIMIQYQQCRCSVLTKIWQSPVFQHIIIKRYEMYVQHNIVVCSRDHCCHGNATFLVLLNYVTVNNKHVLKTLPWKWNESSLYYCTMILWQFYVASNKNILTSSRKVPNISVQFEPHLDFLDRL